MSSSNDTKYCPKCQLFKPRTDEYFYTYQRKTKVALMGYCKLCHNAMTNARAAYRRKNDAEFRVAKSAYGKKYDAENKRAVKAKRKSRKSKMRAERWGMSGELKPQDFLDMFEEQNGRCFYCGITLSWEEDRGVIHDHMIPLSRGGANVIENVVITCMDCNASKGFKTPEEWQKVRGW